MTKSWLVLIESEWLRKWRKFLAQTHNKMKQNQSRITFGTPSKISHQLNFYNVDLLFSMRCFRRCCRALLCSGQCEILFVVKEQRP